MLHCSFGSNCLLLRCLSSFQLSEKLLAGVVVLGLQVRCGLLVLLLLLLQLLLQAVLGCLADGHLLTKLLELLLQMLHALLLKVLLLWD